MKNYFSLPLMKVIAAALFLIGSAGSAVAASDIAVTVGVTPVADNGTHAFGNVPVSGPDGTTTFTITNPGADPLTLASIAFTGTNASEFSISPAAVLTNVAAGGTRNFTVVCNPTSSGSKTAALTISSNAPSPENSYVINLTANGTVPIMSVSKTSPNPDVVITNGGTADFASIAVNSPISRTFTIYNTGLANLTGLVITKSGTHSADYTITQPTAPVSPSDNTTFIVTFTPSAFGTRTASLSIPNNDPSDNPWVINLTGSGLAPAIAITQPAVSQNGTAPFGTVAQNTGKDITFTVSNPGTSPLTLTSFTVTGAQKRNFNIVGTPPTTVAAGATADFTVKFSPTEAIAYSAVLTLVNNSVASPSTSPFTFTLQGTGGLTVDKKDSFGYTQTEILGGNVMPFLVPGEAGVVEDLNLRGIDVASPVDIGFNFFFYEKSYSRCHISTTGLLTFNGPSINYFPGKIPSGAVNYTPDEFIAPLWTDLNITTSSKILYKTVGAAPDRIFILKYHNVQLYNNGSIGGDKRVSFQVQLYESSNSIQIRYQNENPAVSFPTQQVSIGIESRNYSGTPKPGPDGCDGIGYLTGTNTDLTNVPATFAANGAGSPFADNKSILFKRPVVITMESKYQRPVYPALLTNCTTTSGSKTITCASTVGLAASMDVSGQNIPFGTTIASITNATTFEITLPATATNSALSLPVSGRVNVGSLTLGLNPSHGTIYTTPIGTVKRFEAPENIYLDKDFTVLNSAGDVAATDPACYRLVNDGYAIDGQVVQGTYAFFTVTLNRDVTVVWRWKLEYAVIINSATGQGGFGNPSPEVGRQWYKSGDQFTASIDSNITNSTGGFRFNTTGYTVQKFVPATQPSVATTTTSFAQDGSQRRTTVPLTIDVPVRLTWNFVGQVRYRFDALSYAQGGGVLDGQSFVQVDNNAPVYGNGANTDVWVNSGVAGSKVVVGAFYRTNDRSLTLGDFNPAPAGDLAGFGTAVAPLIDRLMPDSQSVSRVARTYTVLHATSPTEIHWVYQPTVFRAQVELGKSLDGQIPNVQLTPALPPGAILKIAEAGPGNLITPKIPPPEGSIVGISDALRWDRVGKQLFPVRPGSYEISWADANTAAKSYKIEILSGYPKDVVRWTLPVEDSDGARKTQVKVLNCSLTTASKTVTCSTTAGLVSGMIVNGPDIAMGTTVTTVNNATSFVISSFPQAAGTVALNAGDYVYDVTLPEIDPQAGFPAQADNAHYRHLYDPSPARQAPTKLDLSATDEWDFQDMTYADGSTTAAVSKEAAGVPFTAAGTGRSVHLYSYRPNSDEIADGSLDKESLAVRVVRSSPVTVISRDSPRLVLGRKALELGTGSATGGAYGIVQKGGATTTAVNPGSKFVVDFWLNAKGLQAPAAVTLSACATTSGATQVTCANTGSVLPGMTLSGTNIPAGTKIVAITNSTTLVLSNAATATGTGISLAATNKPVTVMTTDGGGLSVTLDSAASTATATYRGVQVTHDLPKTGVAWRHYAVHVFTNTFFGVDVAIIDFYLDGVRREKGFVTSWFPGAAGSTVDAGVTEDSLRLGVDAEPRSGLQLDNFRMFSLGTDTLGYLSPGEVRQLRIERDMTAVGKRLRGISPQLSFNFESAPTSGSFANQGTLANVGVGTVTGSGLYAGKWANTDLQEVATRLNSTLDNAGFGGSGYAINAISNYNSNLYTRGAEVGTWGPIFPVNHSQLFTDVTKRLEVAYYENPYLTEPLPHPNVAWPYVVTEYKDVVFPAFGPNKDKAIYIASRIGSEGVDQTGRPQPIFNLAGFSDLKIYNQPDATLAGYNPNEEHAITAPAGRAALKVKNIGEDIPNNPPLAAYALQRDINATSTSYTSDPWVLVQVTNRLTAEPEMAAYQVFKTREGVTAFPRPATTVVNTANSGLVYESATNPDDAFLGLDATKSFNFSYQFDYPIYAGDLLIPPYPLNLVIGNIAMRDARGNSLQLGSLNQRTLWRDVNSNAWVVSGNGRFFHQFFYPFRGDFFLPNTLAGTPVAWLPDNGINYTGTGTSLNPVKVIYNSLWRSDYPKLKRGETLTYQGGEYFSETPGAKGLPALVAMAASEVIYDSATPSMVLGVATTNRYDVRTASARIMRPLDRRENLFTTAQMGASGFTPAATTKVFIVAERWYFKELPGSLQKRFYFDSLAEKLVFRGRLNEKESGDPNLTAGPAPLNILEPNVMTPNDYDRIRGLSTNSAWTASIDKIYLRAQDPHLVTGANINATQPVLNLQGVKNTPTGYPAELSTFWSKTGNVFAPATSPVPTVVPLDSFGVGSALVPSPGLLTQNPSGSLYITIAENNRTELVGAPVSLHIIEIIPDRYRGAIKVIEGSDAFSEKVTLQHNGEFGANTGDLYYEWWIRDAAPLDVVASEVLANGNLTQTDANGQSLWQEYIPADRAALTDNTAKHLGLHSIVFEGRPDVVLADKLVLMRYRHKDESNWKLVPFEFANASTAWKPGNIPTVSPAPFQWAGAANSPQLQADGSKRYIPQLVMGWVKRVLDRINPYEARYADFFSNETPATYSSQIQIAGAPYAGKVALNPDKNVIENTGLIELYRTVLDRAKELSIGNSSNGNASTGINQALLLAATRLSVLYELLGNEAYSDAQDSTINAGEDSSLAGVASYTHAFQNMEADLQHEELALLRGTDFGKSYPVYNRMFWNYAKGLGEAAYNVNYNIYDVTKDGFINEDDARKLYPQGHGDSWGHYVSALEMHYTLLQHPGFTWGTRSELYSLMQNVLEVDFLDEKTFVRLAASKARAGRDIVRESYRLAYTQDPNGQWQGYTDGADPARAWGVSEWAHRGGQAAYFDWAVANALLPADAAAATPVNNPENLDRIDRLGAIDQIGEVAGGLHEIQVAMDEANSGLNPLGLDSDALVFDIELDLYEAGSGGDRRSHFEQIIARAVTAGNNSLTTLDYATQAQNKLRSLADDTDGLIQEAMSQDLDYRNRLIEIFGRPYDGTIGFGKAYPEGYQGADTLLFAYLDKTKIDQIVPPAVGVSDTSITFKMLYDKATGSEIMNNPVMVNLYKATGDDDRTLAFKSLLSDSSVYRFGNELKDLSLPYKTASRYGFQALPDWGQRTSYGKVQGALQNMLADEIELDRNLTNYVAFVQTMEGRLHRLQSEVELYSEKEGIKDSITGVRAGFTTATVAANIVINTLAAVGKAGEAAGKIGSAAIPDDPVLIAGLAAGGSIPTSPVIAAVVGVGEATKILSETGKDVALSVLEVVNLVRDEVIAKLDRNVEKLDQIRELEGMVQELQINDVDRQLRDEIGATTLNLELHRQEYFTAMAEGFRLLRERESFNKTLASKVQKNRYQDMVFRLSRNEAMSKYQTSFNIAARYTWLAARAYDYETSLDPGNPAAVGNLLGRIVKERQLGSWTDGQPSLAHGGLAAILAQLTGNFDVLKGQLGINNPQRETEKISLRGELFRIHSLDPELAAAEELQQSITAMNFPAAQLTFDQRQLLAKLDDPDNLAAINQAAASADRWKDVLKARIVPDLNTLPEFVHHCRPFATGVQPGIVIRFSSCIESGKNFFGHPLAAGDHKYSSANFATKVQGLGVWMDDYNAAGLSTSPRAYLVPIGSDFLRTSSSTLPVTRTWDVVEQRVPTPFILNPTSLTSPNYIPTLDGVGGSFGAVRRHGDFRIYHNNGDPNADDSELVQDSRLISRSIWNSEWMLIIPGGGLDADPAAGLRKLADKITDIKIYFTTTSHQGQ